MAYENLGVSNDVLAGAGIGAIAGAVLVFLLLLILIYYVVMAVSLMVIANKTKTPNGWLAWIPFANVFLMANIAKMHWVWALIACLVWIIPVVGGLVGMVIFIVMSWKICEVRKTHGALSLLNLLPFVQLILWLYLAFKSDK